MTQIPRARRDVMLMEKNVGCSRKRMSGHENDFYTWSRCDKSAGRSHKVTAPRNRSKAVMRYGAGHYSHPVPPPSPSDTNIAFFPLFKRKWFAKKKCVF